MLFAYIDETGDPGEMVKPKSSPVLGMAAVLVDEVSAPALREVVRQLRKDFGVQEGKVMSWKDHVRTHDRRKHVAAVLASVRNIKVIYVYSDKRLTVGKFTSERGLFYNYVALKMYKNILWAARNWKGNEGVHTRFGHVRDMDHDATRAYFKRQEPVETKVPFHLERGLKWVSSEQFLESQAADLFAGCLKEGIWPDTYGRTEGMYIQAVWPQIRTNPVGCVIPLGLMSMPQNDHVKRWDWYRCNHCETE
ncbi:DUF3800 domain-containing protein [Herbiconiux sp. P17]|uniref:DUF3800 domain-containing protein n=1 Tax=Herbiconiux wuyangfengii TaxID=3342794 RepID=UPI0035B6D87F